MNNEDIPLDTEHSKDIENDDKYNPHQYNKSDFDFEEDDSSSDLSEI